MSKGNRSSVNAKEEKIRKGGSDRNFVRRAVREGFRKTDFASGMHRRAGVEGIANQKRVK